MTLREAVQSDLPMLVAMGQRFLASSLYRGVITENVDQMAATASMLVDSPDGCVIVAETDGSGPVGMLGVVAFTHHISGERVGGEVFWWVEPAARGTVGVRLLKAAEAWARAHGASQIQMIAPNERVATLYARLGYQAMETTYLRSLKESE